MKKIEKKSGFNFFTFVLIFLFVMLATCCAIKIGAGSGSNLLSPAFKLTLDENLSEDEREFVESALESFSPSGFGELKISSEDSFKIDLESPETVVFEISVPVTDFYDETIGVSSEKASEFVPLISLTPDKKLLELDGEYFFDTFDSGAKFRILKLKSENKEILGRAAEELKSAKKEMNDLEKRTLSFAQTGVTALSRAMTTTLNDPSKANGNGAYFAAKIKDFLSSKDITHISNESSFAENCKGGTSTMSLCSDWRSLDSITAIGTDIVELSGNHNNNYGEDANIATIKKYHDLGIKTVGGGINSEEAAKPVEIDEKGAKISFFAYSKSTSSVANGELSTASTPGANGYNEASAKAEIAAAKERGDFVIVDVQFSECYCYPESFVEYPVCDEPIRGQQNFFRHMVELGADIVIGTQAHQPQTFEIYDVSLIFYGLGNLFFDQTYWPDTEKGLIITHYFLDGNHVQSRVSPTIYGKTHQPELMSEKDATSYLKRLTKSSPKGE